MTPRLLARFLTSCVLGFLSTSLAAQPFLVEDLNREPAAEDVDISFLRTDPLQDLLYFTGFDPAHGHELWRTDGTPGGTFRLTDVCPGPCSSHPRGPEVFRGRLFFSADDGFSGREPWTSDGSPGGERRVRDLCPGPCSSEAAWFQDVGDSVLFLATVGGQRQLWRTTGPRASTVPLATLLCPVSPRIFECASPLVRVGNRVLFLALPGDGSIDRHELWTSDGTAAGTRTLRSLVPGMPNATSLPVSAGSFAFFQTADDLWRTDATAAGTMRIQSLRDLVSGYPVFYLTDETIWNGALYAISGSHFLVKSDGTPAGTTSLHDFGERAGAGGLAAAGDWLLFRVGDGDSHTSLWRSGGTAATTEKLFDPAESPAERTYVGDIVPLGDRAVFRVHRLAHETLEIWVTDGSPEGTHRLVTYGPEQPFFLSGMVSTGRQAFFLSGRVHFPGIWRSDGTEAGTRLVRDFAAGPGSAGALPAIALPGKLVFAGQTSRTAAPLFAASGSPPSVQALSADAGWPEGFARQGVGAVFAAFEAFLSADGLFRYFSPKGLWRTDGTPAGTARLRDEIYGYNPLGSIGDRLLFAASPLNGFGFSPPDVELWVSDGTAAGTAPIQDINPFHHELGEDHVCQPDSSSPGPAAGLGSRLVFSADDGRHGREPWVTDGTRRGTRLLADLNLGLAPAPGPGDARTCGTPERPARPGLGSHPRNFVPFRNGALFTADDGKSGRELWWTNGVAGRPSGTYRLKDLRPGVAGSEPHDLTPYRGAVYFVASAQGAGEALWRSDGTARGTVRVHDLTLLGNPSWARELTVANGTLFLVVYNEVTGPELWSSRGDAASTALVADLRPGPKGSYPKRLADAGGFLVFAASDGSSGLELWRSDGTAGGTVRLGDLNPGPDASSPGPFTRAGDSLYFGAYESVHGRELWALPLLLP